MSESVSTRGVIKLSEKPRILLVDDVPDNLKLLGSLFDSTDLDLSFAKNAIRALKLAQMSPFELAVLDLELPDINGFTLAERLREIQPECEIIFCSAHNDRDNRDRGFLMGAIDFIEKPFDLQITRTRVRLHIERVLMRRRLLSERDRRDAILSNIRDGVITVNSDGIIVDWNQGAETIFGCTGEKVIAKPLGLLFPEDARNRSLDQMFEASERDSRGIRRLVHEMRMWSGESFMAEISLSAPYELDQRLTTATVRRIADSVTLQQRARLYQQALVAEDKAYLLVTYDGVILEESPAFIELNGRLNLSCGAVGKTLGKCLIGDLFAKVQQGESEFSLERECQVATLKMRVFSEGEHRSAYLITFEQGGAC